MFAREGPGLEDERSDPPSGEDGTVFHLAVCTSARGCLSDLSIFDSREYLEIGNVTVKVGDLVEELLSESSDSSGYCCGDGGVLLIGFEL